MRIQLLDEQTAAKIAAGEVVVDPSAVVKELVENAIDAKATAITINIEDGGKSKIEVTDNGLGIDFEDVELAFARHGTSKIQTMEDLDQLETLGFRGEALASIAAVSRVRVKTSSRKDGLGTMYSHRGNHQEKEAIAWARGTSILVEDLFYNTPARLKHLKKSNDENRKIIRMVQVLSMSHPEISFGLFLDGSSYMKTPGRGDLLLVLQSVFGNQQVGRWMEATYENEPLQLNGYLGSPYETKRNRDHQFIFINNRYISETRFNKAIEDAYGSMLMINQHPVFVLNIHLPSHMLDVNIHPAKTKVQVHNESLFLLLLKDGIRQILRSNLDAKKVEGMKPKEAAPFELREDPKRSDQVETFRFISDTHPVASYEPDRAYETVKIVVEEAGEKQKGETENRLALLLKDGKFLGQLFSTYVMLEKDASTLILIDQHAAHERILYEKMTRAQRDKNVDAQTIMPVRYDLPPDRFVLLMENQDIFASLGFEFTSFGDNQIALRGVPVLLGEPASADLLLKILEEEMLENGTLQERIILAACKKAVKANQKLSKNEIDIMLEQLLSCDIPFTCPHGRPIVVTMDKYGVEKLFKRVT
ncbi:DNA mismatch repair endonuclease MutL [Alkalibacter rhizosphaerae]|uniref:DNA mismatch repair protein MutL n=1 Tax=Alkalibacter rhizosphaerae TaxID=2815577 RepID=A0A974XFH6_9FIRM|nr:DNA mismatch repair endonuclease MutL [Alkalibacter rhizosphaerae]QSX08897.1 DNA mismatch repair endonuclease MutL [Alkalibacter rhizosphaerae]